jgi:hypothetical protein
VLSFKILSFFQTQYLSATSVPILRQRWVHQQPAGNTALNRRQAGLGFFFYGDFLFHG